MLRPLESVVKSQWLVAITCSRCDQMQVIPHLPSYSTHLTHNPLVGGSNPPGATKESRTSEDHVERRVSFCVRIVNGNSEATGFCVFSTASTARRLRVEFEVLGRLYCLPE